MSNALEKILALFGRKSDALGHSQPNSSLYSHSTMHEGSESAKRGQLVQVLMRNLVRRNGMPTGWVECQYQVVNSRTRGKGIFVRLVVKHWDERLMKYAFAIQKTLLTDIVQFDPQATSWLRGISWQLEVASSCPVTTLPSNKFWQTADGAAQAGGVMPSPLGKALEQLKDVAVSTRDKTAQTEVPKFAAPAEPVVPALPAKAATPTMAAMSATPAVVKTVVPATFAEATVAAKVSTPESETAQDLAKLFAIRDQELEQLTVSKLLPVGYDTTQPSPLSAR